jgi:putative membrane protein
MKHSALMAIATAVTMTVACGGGTRENNAANDEAVIGTSGEGAPRGVERFVNDVVAGNTAEIELSRMAAERATNPEVKQFAQMMVRDHTTAGNELKQVLTGHNMQVRDVLDEKHRDLAQELSRQSGSEFDHEYMAAMVDDHERMKNLLEGRSNEKANDQPLENAVNQFAAKTLPVVQHHLDMAQQLEDRLDDTPRRNTTQ